MKLILIAALNKNRVIGRDGKIPWRIPEDLQRFKQITSNHTVLMGRKTFDSIGKPLPNRRNVVISRNNLSKVESVEIFPSVSSALTALENEKKVLVIGGGEIFLQTFDLADEMELTIVDDNELGDTFFPPYEHLLGTTFNANSKEEHPGFYFLSLEKKSKI
ncbi:MAG: dihydrofolate reductase [Bacteroidota bacterium]|nr:dihydrofolate reductase [Bacteroidota bacterium]